MDLSEGAARLEELRRELDRLMQGVRPASKRGSAMHVVELDHDAILRAFFAALLINNPARESGLVWPLMESRVPPALLNDPAVLREKPFLSAPLAGAPTDLLLKIKLMNEKSPWHQVNAALREGLDEDQKYVMRLMDESLLR